MNMKIEELLQLDYLGIQDVNQLKSITNAYNYNIDFVVKQIHELSIIRDRNKLEGITVIQKMTEMEKDNISKTQKFRKKNEQIMRNFEAQKNQMIEDHIKHLQSIESKHIFTMNQLEDKIKSSREKQANLRESQLEEIQFQNQIKQKSLSLVTKQYEHHDNMNKQQEKQLEENIRLFEKNKKLIKQLKRDVKLEAGRIVYQQKQENEDRNYELKARLFELQDQVNKLRKQRNQILKIRNEYKINVSLNEQEVEEYKAVGSIQKSKIKMYSDKIQSIKKTITVEVSKLENKIKEKKSKWENELKGFKLKLFNLEKQKQQLRVNLERYKVLGQTILMQRQEVQQFFLMAIEACKRQMGESGPMLESNQKQYGQKVDIEELLPKDKLRIITNLYTKLALAPGK